MKHIVKRAGHSEVFDDKKLYASMYAACLVLREPTGTAELIAERVTKHVDTWIADKPEVTSNDIRRQAARHLHAYQPQAAYMYLHHRVLH